MPQIKEISSLFPCLGKPSASPGLEEMFETLFTLRILGGMALASSGALGRHLASGRALAFKFCKGRLDLDRPLTKACDSYLALLLRLLKARVMVGQIVRMVLT